MALPTKEERIRRKKVMLAAGINVPNTDESWGPWWDELWKKAITHTKTNDYYGVPSVNNFILRTYDNITGNTTYEAEPLPIGGTILATDDSVSGQIKRTLNNWQHYGDPARDVVLALMPDPSKPVKAGKAIVKAAPLVVKSVPLLVKSIPKLFTREGTRKAVAGTVKFVAKETPKAAAGYWTGKGVDKVSEAITGKSWAENASSMMGFHIEPIFGEMINPGYILGYKGVPLIGRAIWKPTAEDLTPRVYKYVSPAGYFNSKMSRKEEAKNIFKSFIRREKIDINADPVWMSKGIGATSGKGRNMPYLSSKAETQFRDDAFRKYLGLPERPGHNLYLHNVNGTWSYNNDYVLAVRRKYPTLLDRLHGFVNEEPLVPRQPIVFVESAEVGYPLVPNKSYLAPDFLTGNGGMASYSELGNGTSKLFDVWDVNPFSDPTRLGNGIIAKVGNYLYPDFELSTILGKNAKPFIMETTFVPEGSVITNSKDNLISPSNEIKY